MYFIYSIICFLKANIILNVKVVPNDIFKFGGERVKGEPNFAYGWTLIIPYTEQDQNKTRTQLGLSTWQLVKTIDCISTKTCYDRLSKYGRVINLTTREDNRLHKYENVLRPFIKIWSCTYYAYFDLWQDVSQKVRKSLDDDQENNMERWRAEEVV